ncbi:MAG TPA: OsmC family protein [Acidimicrobiia bacterium]|nr:OsmC family protein [Acidimicrobiia bacterium]
MASEVVDHVDLSEPIVRRKKISVSNDGSMLAVHDYGEYGTFMTDEPVAHGGTGEGPSPLQAVLGALCGCESVTFHRTAREMGFEYEGITFDAEFTIDIRGRMGMRGVRQHFQTVRVQATVTTDETPERLSEVVAETEARCPVYNLISDAGVNLEVQWVRRLPA